jgi:hypothetical protein
MSSILVSIITPLGYVGDNPSLLTNFHSHVSNAISKRNASYWTVRVLALADFGCRWLSQLWRVLNQLPNLENLCGHDTGGIREQSGFGRVTSWNGSRVVGRLKRIYSFHSELSVFTINTLKREKKRESTRGWKRSHNFRNVSRVISG